MGKIEHQGHVTELERIEMAQHLGRWYGWGSPIGLSIFFLTLTIITCLLYITFFK